MSPEGLIIGGANVDKTISDIEIIHQGISFSSKNITGLSQGTTYHYRAYATNSASTVYGDVVSFTTLTTVTAPTIIGITVSSTGEIITMQTNEPVILTNVDNEDFTVNTSTLNGATTHQVSSVTPGSIVLTVSPVVPAGATVSISYDPAQGSSTDAITNNAGNPLSSGNITLGNDDFEIVGFSVFPNPTNNGILNITVNEKAEYKLLNIRGQVLKKGVLATGKSKIDISYFANGIYTNLNLLRSVDNFIS